MSKKVLTTNPNAVYKKTFSKDGINHDSPWINSQLLPAYILQANKNFLPCQIPLYLEKPCLNEKTSDEKREKRSSFSILQLD